MKFQHFVESCTRELPFAQVPETGCQDSESLRIGATFGAAALETEDEANDLLLRADRRMLAKKRRRRKAAAATRPPAASPLLPSTLYLRETER